MTAQESLAILLAEDPAAVGILVSIRELAAIRAEAEALGVDGGIIDRAEIVVLDDIKAREPALLAKLETLALLASCERGRKERGDYLYPMRRNGISES